MSGSRLSIVDLFSGVGGFSLGAYRAGFSIRAAIELDEINHNTNRLNFPGVVHLREDISKTSGSDILVDKSCAPDGLIGGPPCQGFSEIGRQRNLDPRNDLFGHFFRLVAEIQPRFFVAENVRGILHPRNKVTVEQALSKLPSRYQLLPPVELCASEFGAATRRRRVFFVGYDPDRMEPLDARTLKVHWPAFATTVGNALLGLPKIRATWQSENQSWRRVRPLPSNEYYDRISARIPKKVGNSAAIDRYRKSFETSGNLGTLHSNETVNRFNRLKPGEKDPISKAHRLKSSGLCPTLRAGTGPERGSYQAVRPIHPTAPRVITPREAARLQGFPDWFTFHHTKWHSFRQIGNSVSPFVAEAILKWIARAL